MLYNFDASGLDCTHAHRAGLGQHGFTMLVPATDKYLVGPGQVATANNGVNLGVQKLLVRQACFFSMLRLQGVGLDVTVLTHAENPALAVVYHRDEFVFD